MITLTSSKVNHCFCSCVLCKGAAFHRQHAIIRFSFSLLFIDSALTSLAPVSSLLLLHSLK